MKDNTPLYRYPGSHAREHGELEQYRASNRANLQCKESIEAAIRVVANLQIFVTLLCENIGVEPLFRQFLYGLIRF